MNNLTREHMSSLVPRDATVIGILSDLSARMFVSIDIRVYRRSLLSMREGNPEAYDESVLPTQGFAT